MENCSITPFVIRELVFLSTEQVFSVSCLKSCLKKCQPDSKSDLYLYHCVVESYFWRKNVSNLKIRLFICCWFQSYATLFVVVHSISKLKLFLQMYKIGNCNVSLCKTIESESTAIYIGYIKYCLQWKKQQQQTNPNWLHFSTL